MSDVFGVSALSGVEILVVEDNEDALQMLRDLLELCGARVVVASSGNEGWRAFLARRPDLVISDIHMPDGDGLELILRIRGAGAEHGGLTPAIAISGACSPEEALGAGFHARLAKPVDPLELVDIVRGFVRDGAETRANWALATPTHEVAVVTFAGHPTAADMRAATSSLAAVLETRPHRVVVDLSQISGFEPAVGSVAERTMWHVRRQIADATIVGGSFLARLVARTACVALGVPCGFLANMPPWAERVADASA